MKALVTGGAGFIGSHIVRTLLNENYEVRVLHLPQEKLTNLEGLDVELIAGDITDPAKWMKQYLVVIWFSILPQFMPYGFQSLSLCVKSMLKEHEPYSMLQKSWC